MAAGGGVRTARWLGVRQCPWRCPEGQRWAGFRPAASAGRRHWENVLDSFAALPLNLWAGSTRGLSDEMHDLRLLHAAGDDGYGLASARQDPVRCPARVVLLDLQGQPGPGGEPPDRRASRRGERNAATAGHCVPRLDTDAAASVRIGDALVLVGALSRGTCGAGGSRPA